MIKTGDWTTYDLVKYLVSIQSTLTSQEVERLQQTSAFPKEDAGKEKLATGPSRKVQRHRAMDLYEPIDIFRELRLPIVDWGGDNRWRPMSDEGKFSWRVAVTGLSDSQLNSQIRFLVGFEASTSVARYSPYCSVGRSYRADKSSRILFGQNIHQVFRLCSL
jgi:Protein of unknown function (DUF3684)